MLKISTIQNTVAVGASFLTAMAPKFCCWSSAIAAVSGGASYLAWVYPMRHWLFALSFASVGYSFYKAYKPRKADNPECVCDQQKVSFLKSKLFTWLVTIFVTIMFIVSYFINE